MARVAALKWGRRKILCFSMELFEVFFLNCGGFLFLHLLVNNYIGYTKLVA